MRYVRTVASGLLACLLAPAAWGADLGGAPRASVKDDTPPYAPGFSWSGLYIGTHVGYAWSQADWQDAVSGPSNHSGSGWLAGAQIGYNWQLRQLVLGVEADASGTWISGSTSCLDANFTCGHSYNWLATARGRVGYAFNGNRTLLYGTAGVAWADIDYATKDAVTGTLTGTGFSQSNVGWVAGAGIEHMLSQHLSARLEYLYYGFDGATAPAGALGPGPTTLNPSTQTLRFGLNFKF
jgi:outer membrane immunogenic protein